MDSSRQVTKNPKGRIVGKKQKEMVVNLYHSFQETAGPRSKCNVAKIISSELGIGEKSVRRIIGECEGTGTLKSPDRKRTRKTLFEKLDNFTKDAIRQKVHGFFRKHEIPTLDKIAAAIREDETLPNIPRSSLAK